VRALLGQALLRRALTRPAAAAAPVTAGLPFVDSPTGLLLCLLFYFAVVGLGFALQSGAPPPATKRADPAWLRAIVLLHNLFLVVLSLYMCGGCAARRAARARLPSRSAHRMAVVPCTRRKCAPPTRRSPRRALASRQLSAFAPRAPPPPRSVAYYAHQGRYILWGNPYKPSERGMAGVIYIFFVSKIYEFMDTFIMLLKGNLRQARLALAALAARCVLGPLTRGGGGAAGDAAARVPPCQHQLHLVDDHQHGAGR